MRGALAAQTQGELDEPIELIFRLLHERGRLTLAEIGDCMDQEIIDLPSVRLGTAS
jgi:hypothetical protein